MWGDGNELVDIHFGSQEDFRSGNSAVFNAETDFLFVLMIGSESVSNVCIGLEAYLVAKSTINVSVASLESMGDGLADFSCFGLPGA